jgi:hypothetical protein
MKAWRLVAVLSIALSGTLAVSSAAGASGGVPHLVHQHKVTVCTGGAIAPGDYGSMRVTGICTMPTGHVNIWGNLTIAPGALLDAVAPGDPTSGTPVVPASVAISGDVKVLPGAVLLLGCSPNISCAPPAAGITFDVIHGDLTAYGAQGVVLHDVAVNGDVQILGGGGGAAGASCAAQAPSPAPINTALAPWSEDPALVQTPVYTDVEDGQIGGDLRVVGLSTCWLGTLRNWVRGNVSFAHNTFGDPDAMEIGNNLIWGDFGCWDNSPAPQFGEGAAPDLVNEHAFGQCSFDTVLQNPSAEGIAMMGKTGVGVSEHFVVSMHSLHTHTGTHTATNVATLPGYPVTTSSGDSIFAQLNSFTLAGGGITGTATYTGGAPGQAPGEADLGVTHTNGWSHFVLYDTCTACSFHGQTGLVTLRMYGVGYPGGHAQGVFLITSAGAILPTSSSPVPGLTTLTGWGTFSGSGSTFTLVEHLGFG